MLNFYTTKKQTEPTMNTLVKGGKGDAKEKGGKLPMADEEREAFIESRVEEIAQQHRDFLKKKPDFNMEEEMKNPAFKTYVLENGLTLEEAFVLVHAEELITEAVQEALARYEGRRNRIAENGAGKNSPAVVKKNPKDLSDKEIDAIIERARNGEKISF